MGLPLHQCVAMHCKWYKPHKCNQEHLTFTPLSIAMSVNDNSIPSHMQEWLHDLKVKYKKEYRNLQEDDGDRSTEEDSTSGDDEPPAKQMKMSWMLVDAQIAQAGDDGLLADLDAGRMTQSMSYLSHSSCASSITSD